MSDVFRPRRELPRLIYDAIIDHDRSAHEGLRWVEAERRLVARVANRWSTDMGLGVLVRLEDVERAERSASGHIDYVAKLAHAVAELVERPGATMTDSRSGH